MQSTCFRRSSAPKTRAKGREQQEEPSHVTFESFSIEIVRDSLRPVGTQNSGDGPLSVTLLSGALYDVFVTYALEVPHGVDPSTSLTIDATIIPEPGTGLLLMTGLVGLALRERRCA